MENQYYCHVCGLSVSDKNSYICPKCGQKLCRRCANDAKFTCPDCKSALPHS